MSADFDKVVRLVKLGLLTRLARSWQGAGSTLSPWGPLESVDTPWSDGALLEGILSSALGELLVDEAAELGWSLTSMPLS